MNNEFKRRKPHSVSKFVLGFIAGGITALLFAPKRGEEIREDIKKQINDYLSDARSKADLIFNDAKTKADGYIKSAGKILDKAKMYSESKFNFSADTFLKEISNLRSAIYAAVDAYKHGNHPGDGNESVKKIYDKYSELDDETLPKHEGMRRGRHH
jgi:gas vesicle protein